jgi:hypothetical protein
LGNSNQIWTKEGEVGFQADPVEMISRKAFLINCVWCCFSQTTRLKSISLKADPGGRVWQSNARQLSRPPLMGKKVKNLKKLNFDKNYTNIYKNRRKGSGRGIEEVKKLRR